jgi:hypothetical protein
MSQIHRTFYTSNSLCIEQLNNFFIGKTQYKPDNNKESIFFSAFIYKNVNFQQKLLLNFFPELVMEALIEEFGSKSNTELINILIRDFNVKDFENFSENSKKLFCNSSENNNSIEFLNKKAFDKPNANIQSKYFNFFIN